MARLLLDHLALGRVLPYVPTELRREIHRHTFPRPFQVCGSCGACLLSYDIDADGRVVMVGGAPYTVLDGAAYRCMQCVYRLMSDER